MGIWGNSSGAELELTADHEASAAGLNHALPLFADCPAAIAKGHWSFYTPVGSSDSSYTASDSATHGQSLWLGADQELCDLEADVRHDSHGFDLCLVSDPDQTCTSGELLRKVSAVTSRTDESVTPAPGT